MLELTAVALLTTFVGCALKAAPSGAGGSASVTVIGRLMRIAVWLPKTFPVLGAFTDLRAC